MKRPRTGRAGIHGKVRPEREATAYRASGLTGCMSVPRDPPALPSLLGVTVRRSLVVGRTSLFIGGGMVVIYAAAFGLGGPLFSSVGAVVLPIFAVSGGLGGVLVFANDRTKGVLEYLVAYGLSPRQILANALITGVIQVTIILAVGTTAGITTYLISGYSLTETLAESLLAYSFPMSYLTVVLMTTIGVFWTSLSSPRAGMNSPIGILPMIGVVPTAVGLILALTFSAHARPILLGIELAMAVAVLALLTRADRLMPPERLLSPA